MRSGQALLKGQFYGVIAMGSSVVDRRLRRRHLKARREAEERRRKLRQETEAALRDEDGSWKDLY